MNIVEAPNKFMAAGYETNQTHVTGFQAIANEQFGGNLDDTLAWILDPKTQPQSWENIRMANESHRWLTDQQALKE